MTKILSVIVIHLFVITGVFSQQNTDSISSKNNILDKIEDYILTKKNDSASYLISQQKLSSYLKGLDRISKSDNPSYLDYLEYIERLGSRHEILYQDVSNYINNNIEQPKNNEEIDLDYVNIKWNQVSKLRDNVSVKEASIIQAELESYINQFNPKDHKVRKAKILSSTHQIVMYIIQKDVDAGKQLCIENYESAKELNDKKLMIISLYYLCEFIIYEGKLDEYISTCEKSLEIENTLPQKSSYYNATLIHIIDAYIYKGGVDERVQSLLGELYNNENSRAQSFSLYAKYLGSIGLKSSIALEIFKQFKVLDLIEFCNKTEKLGEETLNPNDLYQLQREISNTLENHGFLNEAIDFKDKSVLLIKKIYSQDLANSLASYKTNQAVKEKDLQIKHQNERTNLYFIIALLITGLLLISVLAFFRKRKQSQVLEIKNVQINKALKEKELLVREVHHRVKNNFQIVSSLLELQTKGIEDEKALMLANEGKNRVKSMALIHQKLYQNEDGLIDFNEYTHLLVNELTSLYASNIEVETNIEAENMRFDVDTAIPLGLIINELITNAYKYAFVENKTGKLNISIISLDKDNFKLTVSDNGQGLDNNFNIKKAKSLGLRLVTRLVKQLHGELLLTNKNGAYFEILFKDIYARKRID